MLKLNESTLDWALKHIEKFGDTDIFPLPFEINAIRHCWETDVKPFLLSQDISKWNARTHRRCITPKHRYGFRIATQLDPLDTLVFTSLVAEIGQDIENVRLPKRKKIAHSYRFKISNDGNMYDPLYNYSKFRQHCESLAKSTKYNYVVVADIADFDPRVYSHPLENALSACTTQKLHTAAIKRMLKSWNFTVSFGIPVGISASRLLAELLLDDVDRGLLSEGSKHCRHVDDFRIFCKSEKQAYEQLAFLANLLYENHSLTLQQHKTHILSIKDFTRRYLQPEEERDISRLSEKLREILDNLGIKEPYEVINYDDLDEEHKKEVDQLNLIGILKEQITRSDDLDIPLVSFVLRRLGQFDDTTGIDIALKNIDKLYPVFTQVVRYVQALRALSQNQRKEIGNDLLKLIKTSVVGHLEFHRLWIFETFTKDKEWDNEGQFASLFNKYTDEFSHRELILAMGRAQYRTWFKSKKRYINNMEPWTKRAFLAAASCLPGDEFEHWFRSISASLDPLEKAIGKWANENRF